MTALPSQKHIVQWMLDNPHEPVPIGGSYEKCELACALCNLGITRFQSGALMLKSAEHAQQWLNSFG